jgi:hypothetical protein
MESAQARVVARKLTFPRRDGFLRRMPPRETLSLCLRAQTSPTESQQCCAGHGGGERSDSRVARSAEHVGLGQRFGQRRFQRAEQAAR